MLKTIIKLKRRQKQFYPEEFSFIVIVIILGKRGFCNNMFGTRNESYSEFNNSFPVISLFYKIKTTTLNIKDGILKKL